MTPSVPPPDQILSVSQLTEKLTSTLREAFPHVWVSGEVSNFSRSGAGHAYLTIKDASAQLRAVIWRGTMASIPFDVADGLEVIAAGSIDVYAGRGQYQLTIRHLLPKGVGPLELAFRQLRNKLDSEGLFDPSRKRPIPPFPKRIAVVTSPRGAAVRDFLEVAARRWRGTEIIICGCAVQGDAAIADIVTSLDRAQRIDGVEAIALIRGGGSLEDLAAFNSEAVARAVHASSLPIVCGVGHEVDVTIADLVADLRALTPSEAAERLFADAVSLDRQLAQTLERLSTAIQRHIERRRLLVDGLSESRSLSRPLERLGEWARRLDDFEQDIIHRLYIRTASEAQRLESLTNHLHSLSPLATLARGYAIASKESDGQIVRSAKDVAVEEKIVLRLSEGSLRCRVEETHDETG